MNLITDDNHIMLDADLTYPFQFILVHTSPDRIVRIAQQEQF
jgi:hypothetical protein